MSDLPRLIGSFLAACHPPRTLNDVPQHLWEMLRSYRWPGNVRELRNAVQRMLVTPDRVLEPETENAEAAPAPPEELSPLRVARREAADAFERRYVQGLLIRAGSETSRAPQLWRRSHAK